MSAHIPANDHEAREARRRPFTAKRLLAVNAIVEGLKAWAEKLEGEGHLPETRALLNAAERLLDLQPRGNPVPKP